MSTHTTFKRAIVTGASSGIGAAIARELCLRDVEVIAVARSKAKLNKVKKSLADDKQSYFKSVVADIRKPKSIAKILKSSESIDKVDLLVNNAGVGISKPFENHSEQDIDNVISTNLFGTTMLTHGILNRRSKRTPIHIVFVTSLAGKIGFPNLSVYSATKFALEGLAESLRTEYQGTLVKISVLRPGITDTNFFQIAGMKKPKLTHSPMSVANMLLKNSDKSEIIVGSDKYFLRFLPVTPFNKRFKLLNIVNKLEKRK